MAEQSALKPDLFASQRHLEKLASLGDPLVRIASEINFGALAKAVDKKAPRPSKAQGGRPPYPSEVMVRILVLKHLNNLSDEAMERLLLDRASYKRFCQLENSSRIPDRTTIWSFADRIGEAGATAIFKEVPRQLLGKGYRANSGQIIDASLVRVPRQRFSRAEKKLLGEDKTPAQWSSAKKNQKDVEATWTKKHGHGYYGYKVGINVDKRYKIIRRVVTATAATADSHQFEAVLDADPRNNTSRAGYADRGYPSAARELLLKAKGLSNHIQRKGVRNRPLSECPQRRNNRIAKTRARVGHVCAALAQMGGTLIRTIGQSRARYTCTMRSACYNMKRLVYLQSTLVGHTSI